jgi:hypothetical protein
MIAVSTFVALALAAICFPATVWVDVVCWAAALVFLYSVLSLLFSRHHTRAMATGYVLFAGTYILVLLLFPQFLPADKLVQFAPYQTLSDEEKESLQADLCEADANLDRVRRIVKSPTQFETRFKSLKTAVGLKMDEDAAARRLRSSIHAIATVLVGAFGAIIAGSLYTKNYRTSPSKVAAERRPADPAAVV